MASCSDIATLSLKLGVWHAFGIVTCVPVSVTGFVCG